MTKIDRSAWDRTLSRPCKRHRAASGEPCWSGAITGLCGKRRKAALS